MFLPKFNFLLNALFLVPTSLTVGITAIVAGINPAVSQTTIPACQAPSPGQYVLLVVSPTVTNQQNLRSALPSDLKTVTCKYFNDTVTRIDGFNNIDDANRWARYINNVVGLSAIITTRPASTTPTPTVVPSPTTVPTAIANAVVPSQNLSYNPRVLGEGFAVLVDYFNRPELASSLQKAMGGNVGLVSYGERPYLLAVYTTNQSEAYRTLQKLNESGFFALLADGRKVMLLRSVVNYQ
ncbi:MAG: hypothetical protein EAZ76_00385 [Nostocales cyanobacterium]|nr:MAG: hypothetical protein EAZ87_22745 [Nostocales cyanobacterium]TAF21537.1 MAG: hypothetical protein EAZ76_00385 [Nostocales cyanobacterium]